MLHAGECEEKAARGTEVSGPVTPPASAGGGGPALGWSFPFSSEWPDANSGSIVGTSAQSRGSLGSIRECTGKAPFGLHIVGRMWIFKKKINLFIWLHQVLVASHGIFIMSLWTSVVVAHELSHPKACGIFPDQGSNPCSLCWKADS